jgi:hypothetical protein
MSGLSARHMTAGLDEIREAGGWIKGARFVRVTGFGLSCFGISSRGFIVCLCTSLLPALAGQLVRAIGILKRVSPSPEFPLGCGIFHLWSTKPRSSVPSYWPVQLPQP